MTITLHNPRSRQKTPLLAASLSLFTLVGLLTPSLVRADVTVTVDQGQNASQHKTSGGGATGGNGSGGSNGSGGGNGGGGGKGGGKGGKGGGSTTDTISGSTFYTITVHNLATTPVKGLVVEYHVYNKTTTSGGGQSSSSVTLDDISNSVTIDLGPSENKQIETSDIPHVVTNTTTAATQGKGGKPGTAGSTSSSVQNVLGWVVYLELNGKKVPGHVYQGPTDDVEDKAAQYLKKQNGG